MCTAKALSRRRSESSPARESKKGWPEGGRTQVEIHKKEANIDMLENWGEVNGETAVGGKGRGTQFGLHDDSPGNVRSKSLLMAYAASGAGATVSRLA